MSKVATSTSTTTTQTEALETLTKHIGDLFDVAAVLAALNHVGARILEREEGDECEDGNTITHVSKIGQRLLIATIAKLDAACDQLKATPATIATHPVWSLSENDGSGVVQ